MVPMLNYQTFPIPSKQKENMERFGTEDFLSDAEVHTYVSEHKTSGKFMDFRWDLTYGLPWHAKNTKNSTFTQEYNELCIVKSKNEKGSKTSKFNWCIDEGTLCLTNNICLGLKRNVEPSISLN